MTDSEERFGFETYPDLVSHRIGGRVVAVSDEFFAPAENLLRSEPARWDPERYTDRGKWMDGWESRRRRGPGHDWCVVRLAARGTPRGAIIDTAYFRGNQPESASIEGCDVEGEQPPDDDAIWCELLPSTPLDPDRAHGFRIDTGEPCTHVRLNIYPDGGVARLRIHGQVAPDWDALRAEGIVELSSVLNGGRIIECSDAFFSQPGNLLVPDPACGMHDGWETRRRRGPGNDWVVIALGRRSTVAEAEISTRFFKGNYPGSCSVDILDVHEDADDAAIVAEIGWETWLPRTPLSADSVHRFGAPLVESHPATHLRLNIYPDGGVARFRAFGTVDL